MLPSILLHTPTYQFCRSIDVGSCLFRLLFKEGEFFDKKMLFQMKKGEEDEFSVHNIT